jgi:tetratricopeptide (TPR) repeat protein
MRKGRVLIGLFLAAVSPGGVARADHSPEPEPPADVAAGAMVPLLEGVGGHHRAVTTSSPLAQRYFDQGLRLVYAFNHDEARRAFEEAARLDPGLSMAHWGVALTLGPNINMPADPERERAAYAAVQRALATMGGASPAEQGFIRALAERYAETPGGDRRARDLAYAEAMRALSHALPDDLDAATLFAEALMDLRPWDLWTRDGRPQPGTLEIVATLESVLARDPDHPGANHYYIHAVEASPHPERALASARRLPGLMPGAGHPVHMPSHIYMRLGMYAEASDANAQAILADRAYLAVARPEGMYRWMYYPHNLQFLAVSSGFEGRREVALLAARAAAAEASGPMVSAMPMLQSFRAAPYLELVRFGAWEELLREPAPPEDQRYASAIHTWARGVALARTGHADLAAREHVRFEAARGDVPEELTLVANNRASAVLAVASAVLAAELAAARGRTDLAVAALERAVDAEDELAYGEPPDWPLPARHRLGAVLLAAGRAAEAEAVYREDLRRHPANGWALFGLAESLKKQGRDAEAAPVRERFRRAFARADVTLPEAGG